MANWDVFPSRDVGPDEQLRAIRVAVDPSYNHDKFAVVAAVETVTTGKELLPGRTYMTDYRQTMYHVVRATQFDSLSSEQRLRSVDPRFEVIEDWVRAAMQMAGSSYLERMYTRIGTGHERCPGVVVLIESNGLGKPMKDGLQRHLLRVLGPSRMDRDRPGWRLMAVNTVAGRKGLGYNGAGEYSAGKEHDIAHARMLLDSGRLEIDPSIDVADELRSQLDNFSYLPQTPGSLVQRMSAPAGQFDDLLMALSIAVIDSPSISGTVTASSFKLY